MDKVGVDATSLSDDAHEQPHDTRAKAPDAEPHPCSLSRQFAKLPNSVARDKRLGPAGLVLIAFRSTMTGNYVLNEKWLRKHPIVRPPAADENRAARSSGLGKNVIRRAIAENCDAGYLERQQKPSTGHGKFAKGVIERLALPPAGASRRAFRLVWQEWFDGKLTLNQLAAYLYLRAGTAKGRATYTRELMARFGWSRPTASAVMRDLVKLGLVAERKARKPNGQMDGVSYTAQPPANLWKKATVKKPGIGLPGIGLAGDILTCLPSYTPPSEDSPLRTTNVGKYASHGEAAPLKGDDGS